MKLTEVIVKRPISALIIIIGILLFGFMSIVGMEQELTPEIDMPVMLVMTVYGGAGPEDVEKLVTQRVEGAVGSLSGLKTIYSYSLDNISMVMVQYEYGTDMDTAYIDMKEKLDRINNSLPDDANSPTVIQMDVNAMASVYLSIQSDGSTNLLNYVEDEIVPEFEKLSTVADISVSGGQEDYIRVELLEDKMQQYGVTMNSIITAVSTADFSMPTGDVDFGSQNLSVRSAVEYKTTESLRNIPLTIGRGSIIRLDDVANVYEAQQDASSISRYNGDETITLSITKRQSASAVSTSRQVMQVVEQLNNSDLDITVDVIADTSDTIRSSINSVASTLILGVVISMIVLFVFLGDVKASLIVGSSMPVSLLVSFIFMSLMGFTLNVVTMSGMVLGVGMMVDNSIVVLDSCFKTQTKERSFMESTLMGTKFVLASIIGSTITTVVVFLPLATIEGMSGQLFRPLGFTIIFSLTASLFSAITLVPLFYNQFMPREKRNAPAALFLKKVERGYGKLLKGILKKKKTVVALSALFLAVSIFFATMLNMELMPASDEGTVVINVETRPGLKLERLDELMHEMEEMVSQHPDVERYSTSVGGTALMGSSNSITAYLYDKRSMKTDEVVEMWRQETKNVLDCNITVNSSSSTMSSMSSDEVEINLTSSDLSTLREFSREVDALMRAHPDMVTVSSSLEDGSPQAEVIVDPVKAAAFGLTPIVVAQNVNMALSGVEATTLTRDGRDYSIYVEYPQGRYNDINDLNDMILVSPLGTSVALTDIATIKFTNAPQTIIKEDNQYIVTVTGTPVKAKKFDVEKDILAQVNDMRFPDGISMAQSTMQEMMNEEFMNLGTAIAVAVFLVFMVMTIQFESMKHALMVMVCIPFSLIGSFTFLFLARATISMVSLLGFLVLVGTVVNNGILFVDTTNEFRKSMDLHTALVHTGRHRLRPILMTTLTTVLSMIPLAIGLGTGTEMMQGLGLVVIGGLTASTILTLLLLPTFYLIIDGNPDRKKRRAEKRRIKVEKRHPLADEG